MAELRVGTGTDSLEDQRFTGIVAPERVCGLVEGFAPDGADWTRLMVAVS
jgi:hypothetical protein